MKWFSTFIIMAIVTSTVLFSSCSNSSSGLDNESSTENIIQNGSFTETEKLTSDNAESSGWTDSLSPLGWVISNTFNSKDYIAQVDKKESADKDKASLKIGGDDTVRVIASQHVSGLEPERGYRLSGWIKTRDYKSIGTGSAATGPVLQVVALNTGGSSGIGTGVHLTEKLIEDKEINNLDWTYVEVTFTPGSSNIRIDCHFNSGSGYAWFDGLKLSKMNYVKKVGETVVTDNLSVEVFDYGTINAKSYQQDGIASYNGWQYAGYYNEDRYVCLSRRKLPDGDWETIIFDDYVQKFDDGHASLSIGICPGDGSIHIAFDCMSSEVKTDPYMHYRKSIIKDLANNPEKHEWTADLFGPVQNHLTGTPIKVSYPRFITTPDGGLIFEHRAVGSPGYLRQLFIHEYNPDKGEWAFTGKYMDNEADTGSAYVNGLDFDSKGRLHVTWTWRARADGLNANHDICYAYSDDIGKTWYNNKGEHIATAGETFIKEGKVDVEVVDIPEDTGILNSEGQFVDNEGRIHVLMSHIEPENFGKIDPEETRANSYYYHYWRDDKGIWHQNKIPVKAGVRGKIVFDKNDNAYAILQNMMIACATKESNWTDWAVIYDVEANKFSGEVNIDRYRIKNEDGILSMLFVKRGTQEYLCLDYELCD